METTLAHPPRVRLRSVLPRPLSLCNWTDFPVMHDTRGNLSFIEGGRHIPFDVERVYYLYDIPSLAERAGHAHRQLSQVFIALSGSFDLHLDMASRSVPSISAAPTAATSPAPGSGARSTISPATPSA